MSKNTNIFYFGCSPIKDIDSSFTTSNILHNFVIYDWQ